MFCQKCGAELAQGALFCIKCGSRAPAMADFEYVTGNEAVNSNEPGKEEGTDPVSVGVTDRLTSAVISFQDGEASAFDTVYNESKKYVYYTILKTTGDKDVADDILQETYIDVYRSLDQLQSPAAFKGWAARIAQHKISRYYRKKSPELFSTEEEMDDTVGELIEDDMSALPEDAIVNKEVQRLISEIIDELPENQKGAIVSFYYNQMSISEIAESMGVPENTVKTYLFRGKKKIKDGVLEIEKKHGTKLYALPLAGLLGLLFTEEAKAAVVTTTASQVLGSVATAGGTVASVAGGMSAAAARGMSGTVSTSTASTSTAAYGTVTSVTNSMACTGSTATSSGMISSTAAKAAAKTTARAAGGVVKSSIRTIAVSTAAGLVIGSGVTAAVTHHVYEEKIIELEEAYEDDSVDLKSNTRESLPEFGKKSNKKFIGRYKEYHSGWLDRYLEINEDSTASLYDSYDTLTGDWKEIGDKNSIELKLTEIGTEIFYAEFRDSDNIDVLVVSGGYYGDKAAYFIREDSETRYKLANYDVQQVLDALSEGVDINEIDNYINNYN